MDKPFTSNAYWSDRLDLLYYQVIRQLVDGLGSRAESMLDVGSKGCPYLGWFPHIPVRYSIDIEQPYSGEGITAITTDFLDWQSDRRFDIVTCLQVLEHVPEPAAFARKLLAAGRVVIVSVPYAWPPGSVADHLHDPVTERKMRSWFGREPNFSFVCREVVKRSDRLIQVYEPSPVIWSNLAKRAQRMKEAGGNATAPSRLARISRALRKSSLPKLARRHWKTMRHRLGRR
jgi:hypothetical protein